MGISMKDSKLVLLAKLISDWPGLVARPDLALIEDCLVLTDHLGDGRTVVDVGSGRGAAGLAAQDRAAPPGADAGRVRPGQGRLPRPRLREPGPGRRGGRGAAG